MIIPTKSPSRQLQKNNIKVRQIIIDILGKIFEKQKKFRVLFSTNNSACHTYFVNDILCFLVSTTLFVGSYLFIHWLGIIATIFIAVFIPIYCALKRTRPQSIRILLKLHVFGNLFAFLLVSIHFAQNLARLAGFLQRLGDGLTLYLVLLIIVAVSYTHLTLPTTPYV